ncbi:hypothetical protein [Haloterrigena alkaliphila]|uniref:hypothetical protein n=1 Tax=Haloterrigena alkaliphila TaxID=2816475 RepID=UPI001CFFB8FB|nr:hypothetical protein [Haloterrigena alkaliphila]UHQ95315.1 hypothetical protein J0X25_20825 [Haloterrigena alkaliphila]
MRLRLPDDADALSTREPPADATDTARNPTPTQTFLLVALASAALAYVVSRLRSSSDTDSDSDTDVDAAIETVRDRTVAALPSAVGDRVAEAVPAESQSIPIGGRESTESEAETGTDSESDGSRSAADAETGGAAPDAGDPIDDEEMNADLADEPSPTKVSSGSSEEIQDKPAEPGEMAVDEGVEDLVDESLDDAGDESDVDEEE